LFSAGVGRRAAGVYRKRVTSADRAPSHSNRMSLAARTSTPGCSSASNWTPVGPWSALTSWPATNASSATPRPARRPLQVSKPYRDVEDSSLSAGSRSTTSPSTDGSSIHTAAGRGRPPLPARCRSSLVRGRDLCEGRWAMAVRVPCDRSVRPGHDVFVSRGVTSPRPVGSSNGPSPRKQRRWT